MPMSASLRGVVRRVEGRGARHANIPEISPEPAGAREPHPFGTRLAAVCLAILMGILWSVGAHAQVVFNEDFGTTNSHMPTAQSTADPTWLLAECLNGFISLNTGISPTPFLHHNTDSGANCTYASGQAVWRNINSIPVEPNRTYTFSYRSAQVNDVSDAVLSQAVSTNAGGSISVLSTSTPAWGADFAWVSRQVVFRTNPGTTSVDLRINNANTAVFGNDFIMDDIVLEGWEADLSITKDDGSTEFTRGADVTYTIVVSNAGPENVVGASVSDPLPTGISSANWTCVGAGGGVCGAASGTGAINSTADLPAGSSVTYTLTMTVPAGYPGVILTNTATVATPGSLPDPDTSNNTATDTNAVSPPQPSFGACTSTMYLGVGAPTQLHSIDTSTNPFTYPPIGSAYSPGYNAMGYDPLSNFIYAAGWDTATSTYRLQRVGGDGSVADLGAISGGGINASGPGIASGEVGADGFFYVKHNTTTNQMWRVDLTTRAATLITLSQPFASGDITWSNGLLYAQDHVTGFLISVDPANGNVTPIGPSGFIGDADAFGSMMGASNGVFGRRNSGGFYRFDPATGQATLISNAPAGGGDGAKCATSAVEFPVDVSITKTDGSTIYSPGTNVTYTIVVSNSGPFGVAGAMVSDPLPSGITTASWTCGTPVNGGVCGAANGVATGGNAIDNASVNLPVDASVTFELTINVPPGFTGALVNTASVTTPSGSPDTNTGNNSATDTDQPAAPALTIVKTGTLNDLDGDGLIDLGETISYSFLVTNAGDVTMTDVTVNDPLVTVNQGSQTLAPGGSFTFTASYSPTQADIDNGSVTNTATGTGTEPGGNTINSPSDSVTVPPQQTPGFSIDKVGTLNDLDGDGLIDLGETITYTFVITNTGNLTMANVTPDDPMLAGAGVSVAPGPQTLGPGDSATFTATYEPTQADIDAGSVTNTATASGTEPDGDPIESPPDSVTVPPDQTPGLTVEKTGTLNDLDGDGLIDLGETVSYSFLVTNTGAVTMTNVTVDDPLLVRNGLSVTPGPVTLGRDGRVTFTATYSPNQDDIDAGSVTNTARGTGTTPGGDTIDSPPDTVTVPPDQAPALTVDKTGTLNDLDGDGLIDPGESIEYAFVVTNTGRVTMTGVTVDDPLLTENGVSVSPGPQTLAPNDSATFTATYTPTQNDIDAGSVENTATVNGTGPSGNTIDSPPDTVTVPPQGPQLSLRKTGRFNDVDGNGYASVGDTLTYTLIASNDGAQTVANVRPDDPGPTFNGRPAGGAMSEFEPGPITLEPRQRAAFTATYTLTADDIINAGAVPGGIVNSATLSGSRGTDVITSNGSTSIITLPAAAPGEITVTKVADLRRIYRGQQAPFTIRVTNNSPTTATGITVIDTMPSGFRYVDGSASVDGVSVTPEVAGLRVRLTGLTVPGNGEIVIRLRMLALSSAGPGEHVNRASATDAAGNTVSNEARATVEIMAEPVFDCGDIIGRVFDDENRNGYQDEGEPGLPGVRVATVNGWLVTTDAHGRFHVACAALPDQRIGSNFIMKVDTRTLPTGYRLTTENPRVVRLTAGKMTELNFGASVGRVVRLDLQDAAFEPGEIELREQWAEGIDQLIAFLAVEQSVLRLTYLEPGGDVDFAEERLEYLAEIISERWRQTSGQYRLEIEMRVETGK